MSSEARRSIRQKLDRAYEASCVTANADEDPVRERVEEIRLMVDRLDQELIARP